VTNRQRSPIASEVPTAEEAGFPELTFEGVVGFFGGGILPVVLRDRIARDIAAVAESPEISSRLRLWASPCASGLRRNSLPPLKNSAQRWARSFLLKAPSADHPPRPPEADGENEQCVHQKPIRAPRRPLPCCRSSWDTCPHAWFIRGASWISDLLAAGPQTAEALAQATNTGIGPLRRLLRALASMDLLEDLDVTAMP